MFQLISSSHLQAVTQKILYFLRYCQLYRRTFWVAAWRRIDEKCWNMSVFWFLIIS